MKKIMIALVALVGVLCCTACDGGRFAAAKNHLNGDICYVYDFKLQVRLEPTPENITKTEGDSFWADPKQCK